MFFFSKNFHTPGYQMCRKGFLQTAIGMGGVIEVCDSDTWINLTICVESGIYIGWQHLFMTWIRRYKQKSLYSQFQLIPILRFQVMHDYVCFIAKHYIGHNVIGHIHIGQKYFGQTSIGTKWFWMKCCFPFHCSHRLLCWIKYHTRLSVKIALISYWNDFSLIPLGKCAS